MHKIDIVKDKIKECKTKISMIPGGLTKYLLPLYVSINKPLKDELKKRYTKILHRSKRYYGKGNPRRYDKLCWIDLIWW